MRVRNSRRVVVVVATSLAFGSRDIIMEEGEDRKRPEAVSRRAALAPYLELEN